MADNIEYITFDNDKLGADIQGSTPQKNTVLTGTVKVDYTTNTVTGLYKVKGDNGDAAFGINVPLQKDQFGDYVFSDRYLTVNYSGQQPMEANLITFKTDPNNFASDQYSSSDEPPATLTSSTTNPTCFVTGTAIATRRGSVAVEHLAVGDMALTASGDYRPVRWIGRRAIEGARGSDLPVRIAAGAFGAGLPERELRLSPGHPVLVGADADGEGGHLVPIMCLVNGTTIERMPVETVTYWHVELDQHDILLAEGLPAESYLDWGDRVFFTEGADHALANPDFVVPGLAGRCRPVALDGPVVDAERRRLDAVFNAGLATACVWPSTEETLALS